MKDFFSFLDWYHQLLEELLLKCGTCEGLIWGPWSLVSNITEERVCLGIIEQSQMDMNKQRSI